MKFNATVGNPPYQRETGAGAGDATVANIFQFFQETALAVGHVSCLIYPGERWAHGTGKGMQRFGQAQANSPDLQKIIVLPDSIFPNVGIRGALTIVHRDKRTVNEGRFTLQSLVKGFDETLAVAPGERELILEPRMNSIVDKIRGWGEPTVKPLPQKCFGLESSFIDDNPGLATPVNEVRPADTVRALLNNSAGKSGRASWYWLPEKIIVVNRHLIPKYKIVVSSFNPTGINGRSPRAEILSPGDVFGRSRLGLIVCDTLEEAQNALNWLHIPLIRMLFTATGDSLGSLGSAVPAPNLADFEDSPKQMHQQLCHRYGLTEEENLWTEKQAMKLAPLAAIAMP